MSFRARLIEPSMKQYTKVILQKCKETRFKYHSLLLNIGMIIVFIGILGSILYFSRKNKEVQDSQIEEKKVQKEIYIMDTLRKIKAMEKERRGTMISSIPYDDKIFM